MHKSRRVCVISRATYRVGREWKSELDYCILSPRLVYAVKDFMIDYQTALPSNHAPITVTFDLVCLKACGGLGYTMVERSKQLGQIDYSIPHTTTCKQIKIDTVDWVKFTDHLQALPVLPVTMPCDINISCAQLDDALRECAARAHTTTCSAAGTGSQSGDRWNRLVDTPNSRQIWEAINWNGTVSLTERADAPKDTDFKRHFENLLNPTDVEPMDPSICHGSPYIPATDDPFTPGEVDSAIRSLKAKGGPSGIPPGLLKLLTPAWIISLTILLNVILTSAAIPAQWAYSRLVVIFKKGHRHLCDNYRGISIMDSQAKLFDLLLCRRLELWFRPDREQAGAQKGRGCTEHILILRLLYDYAVSKKVPLYVGLIYVDFS